jgi:ELWxxDGT repeat protein
VGERRQHRGHATAREPRAPARGLHAGLQSRADARCRRHPLYFTASDAEHGLSVWQSDGSTAGTRLALDAEPGPNGIGPSLLAAVAHACYVRADDGVHGEELWRLAAGEGPMLLEPNESGHGSPASACPVGARLFFSAIDAAAGRELWVTDGTRPGTRLVADLRAGPWASSPRALTALGDRVFFFADALGGAELELWQSDGSAAGTSLLFDGSGSPSFAAERMVGLGRSVCFLAGTAAEWRLWRSDGTPQGTFELAVLGSKERSPELVAWNDRVWFERDDGVHGRELWSSDGSNPPALVVDLRPGPASAGIETLVAGPHSLWFRAVDASGLGMYASDGSGAGTFRLIGLAEDPWTCCALGLVVPVGTRRAFFRANDLIHGNSLFVSDGTAVGTARLPITIPHPAPWQHPMVLSRGQLIFVGQDAVHGDEPWRLDPGATAQPVGWACASSPPAPRLSAGDPVLGASSHVVASDGPLGSTGFLLFGIRRDAPIPLFGGALWLDPLEWLPLPVPLAAGDLPIPSDPALARLLVAMQTVYLVDAETWRFETSNAVYLTLGH